MCCYYVLCAVAAYKQHIVYCYYALCAVICATLHSFLIRRPHLNMFPRTEQAGTVRPLALGSPRLSQTQTRERERAHSDLKSAILARWTEANIQSANRSFLQSADQILVRSRGRAGMHEVQLKAQVKSPRPSQLLQSKNWRACRCRTAVVRRRRTRPRDLCTHL